MNRAVHFLALLLLIFYSSCSNNTNSIVGKWEPKKDKSVYFEFTDNGNFDIKNSKTDKSILGMKYKYSTYEQNGIKKIKFSQIVNDKEVRTRHEVYKLENDVLKLETTAYGNHGSKSWFESYYRAKK